MKTGSYCATITLLTLFGMLVFSPAWAQDARMDSGATDPAQRIYTVAYFEAGPYWEFTLLQQEVTEALDRLGVLPRIYFDQRFWLSPGWDAAAEVYREAARQLMNAPEVDLIICMGTVATKALLAENNGRTPIVSINVADPVASGIVDPETGKGALNLTLQYTRDKWQQAFVLFHQALPFTRMGIMYHDSPEGRSYSNVPQAREVARERGFTLVEYSHLDQQESEDSCAEGVRELISRNIDAFYISALNCFDWTQANPRKLIDSLHSRGIRTYSRDGTVHVRQGALMGLSTLDYTPLGEYYADRISRLLGIIPEGTPVVQDRYRPKITLNLDTARSMGVDAPLIVLISADEIFDSSISPINNSTMNK